MKKNFHRVLTGERMRGEEWKKQAVIQSLPVRIVNPRSPRASVIFVGKFGPDQRTANADCQ
jgi:hypothetical protein